jgi:outer membrane lipoprotein-sorting protein
MWRRPRRRRSEASTVRFIGCALLLVGAVAPASPAEPQAEQPPRSARQLLDEVKHLNDTTRAWKDLTRRMQIVIHDRRGGKRNRDLLMRTRRGKEGEDKTLVVFQEPAEIRGTSLLQFDHQDRDAEQWLYLPELGRVRTISAQSKDESFMGTDFSYRDLELLTDVTEWTEEEARSSLKGVEEVGGTATDVIELVPLAKDVGYSRIVVALAKDDLTLRRMQFYGEGSEPEKVLELGEIQTIDGIPTARSLVMRQPSESTHTVVQVSDVKYNQELDDKLFTKRALERGLDE